jgi:hypothetical protein
MDRVILEEIKSMAADELPEGWGWLSTWDTRTTEQRKTAGPTGDYGRLIKAADAKKIRAYKQDNAWAIHLGDANAFVDAARTAAAATQNVRTPVSADKLGIEDALKSLERAVAFWGELIASHVEQIELNTRPR